MSDAPLTTEERLYSLSKQKLWAHVAQEQNRSMIESEEYDLWLVATESCRKEIERLRNDLAKMKEAFGPTVKFLKDELRWHTENGWTSRQWKSELDRLKKLCSP